MRDRMNPTAVTANTTVNDVIWMYPESVSVFNDLGIDACCGGDASLADAATRDGVDLETMLARLDAMIASSSRTS